MMSRSCPLVLADSHPPFQAGIHWVGYAPLHPMVLPLAREGVDGTTIMPALIHLCRPSLIIGHPRGS
jgi:hypothetical protein